MGASKLDNIIYNQIIEEYQEYGMGLSWTKRDHNGIKLHDMSDSHIDNCIYMLKMKQSPVGLAWIDIFNDVKTQRRSIKINQIFNV